MARIVHVAILVDLPDNGEVADGMSALLCDGPEWVRDWSYSPADQTGGRIYYAVGDDYEEGDMDAVAWPA